MMLDQVKYLGKSLAAFDVTRILLFLHNLMGCLSFRRLMLRMTGNTEGRAILAARPRVTHDTIKLNELLNLPKETFGYLYARHIINHGFDRVLEFPPQSPFENDSTAYCKMRWRETHDFRHVLTGIPATFPDETIIAAFQYGNFRNSWSLLVCLIGPLFSFHPLSPLKQWKRMLEAYQAGKNAVCLASINYEAEFSNSVSSLRDKWQIKDLTHLSSISP